jgi:hypothetical protein
MTVEVAMTQEVSFEEPRGAPENAVTAPYSPEDAPENAVTPPYSPDPGPPPTGVQAAVDRHRDELLAIDGIVAVSVGRTPVGDDGVIVYADRPTLEAAVPEEVEGYAVQIEVVPGGFDAWGSK